MPKVNVVRSQNTIHTIGKRESTSKFGIMMKFEQKKRTLARVITKVLGMMSPKRRPMDIRLELRTYLADRLGSVKFAM
jgi:hypothetical protein